MEWNVVEERTSLELNKGLMPLSKSSLLFPFYTQKFEIQVSHKEAQKAFDCQEKHKKRVGCPYRGLIVHG